MCPKCFNYIILKFDSDLIKCPTCGEKVLRRSEMKIDMVGILKSNSSFVDMIQERINKDPKFLEQYKGIIPILEGNGVVIPKRV
jgi:DNA-directed RNA polymerase subunit RPC12/RpoP